MGPMGIDSIFPDGLSLNDAAALLTPVLVVLLGMAAYAVFVFKFYRFVAARDMFGLDLSRNDAVRDAVFWDLIFLVWYLVRYVILFPAFAFFWFAVMTLILVFLSEDRELSHVLLIAMATVSAIRVAAYYNEELSRDLAKILPFAVLGVFIIDTSFFNIQTSLTTLEQINTHRETIVYYLLFLVCLEFALRFLYVVLKLLFGGRREAPETQTPAAPPAQQSAQPNGRTGPVAASDSNGQRTPAGVPPAPEPEVNAGPPPA